MLALGGDRGSHGNITRWYDYVASRSEVQQVCNKMKEAEKVSGDDECRESCMSWIVMNSSSELF